MQVYVPAVLVDEDGVSHDIRIPIGVSGHFTRTEVSGHRTRVVHLDLGAMGESQVELKLPPREKTYAEIGALAPSTVRGFGGCGEPDPKTGYGCCDERGHFGQHDWQRTPHPLPQEKK